MRSRLVLVATVALAACGGSGVEVGSSETTRTIAPVASTTADTAATTPVTTAVTTATVSPSTTGPARAGTSRDGGVPGTDPSIEAALLSDDAFGAPWEAQRRRTDVVAWDVGPNQTDCEPYWEIERLRSLGGGHVSWWADGGNANQYVFRDPTSLGEHVAPTDLATQCPQVRWLEGGSFTVEAVPVADGAAFRFVDDETGDVTWFAFTAVGDLVAVLDVPLWTGSGGRMIELGPSEIDAVVTRMHELLVRAADLTTTTSVPLPVTTSTSRPVTTTEPLDELAAWLLGPGELPEGFVADEVRRYSPGASDEALIEVCPAAVTIDEIDAMLRWQRSADGPRGQRLEQLIGRAGSPEDAAGVVRRFAEVAACDLAASYGSEVLTTGGATDVSGASAAASLRLEAADGSFVGELVVVAVGDVVSVVSVELSGATDDVGLSALAELAVARIVSRS